MAVSAEELASGALELLGEGSIEDLDDTGIAGVTRSNYNDLVYSLFSMHNWWFAQEITALSVDGSVDLPSRWGYAHLMPEQPGRAGSGPTRIYNSSSDFAAPFTDFRIAGQHILSNQAELWGEFTIVKPVRDWPGPFTLLVKHALAGEWAVPVTENMSRADYWRAVAFGNPSEGGRGGNFAVAVESDRMNAPAGSMTETVDPVSAARFGGRRY